jgi:hypothetical protein
VLAQWLLQHGLVRRACARMLELVTGTGAAAAARHIAVPNGANSDCILLHNLFRTAHNVLRLTHSPTDSPTHPRTSSLAHSPSGLLPHPLTHALAHSLTHPLAHSPTHSPTQWLSRSLTHWLTHPLACLLAHALAQERTSTACAPMCTEPTRRTEIRRRCSHGAPQVGFRVELSSVSASRD